MVLDRPGLESMMLSLYHAFWYFLVLLTAISSSSAMMATTTTTTAAMEASATPVEAVGIVG